MFVVLAVILALAWVFGFAVYHVASVGIHLLLALAVISVIVHFLRGTRARVLFSKLYTRYSSAKGGDALGGSIVEVTCHKSHVS